MIIGWHALPFTHIEEDGSGCGKDATMMEICVSSDGYICVSGMCHHCGVQFSSPQVAWATIMRNVAIKDHLRQVSVSDALEDMDVRGRPC